MPKTEPYNWKKVWVWWVIVVWLTPALLPTLTLGGTSQTLRQQRAEGKRPKLAPDLEEALEAAEKGKTLGDVRREKMQQPAARPHPEVPTIPPTRTGLTTPLIINLNSLATDVKVRACLLRLGGRVRRVHPNLGVATVEVPIGRVRELAAETDIEYVSPDRPLTALGHIETTTGADQSRALAMLNGVSTLDGTGVGIVVIDSGIDANHKLIRPSNNHPGVIAAADFTTTDALTDRFGHGTFVASMVAGSGSLGKGAYEGIAPSASLISLKVLDNTGVGLASNLIAALDWCIFNRTRYNIRIINLSLGTTAKDSYQFDPLCLAVRRAHNAGMLVVAAAGNEGKDARNNKLYGGIHSPGIDPSVLTVGAVNTFGTDRRSDDRIVSYSSRGPTRGYYTDTEGERHYDNLIKPDLVAPGNRLIGASSRHPEGAGNWNVLTQTYPLLVLNRSSKIEDRLMFLSGTSVAAPIVAGAAALLYELNPNLTPNLVKAILMYSAQPLRGFNTLEQGAGLLNIDGAVRITRLVRANPALLNNGSLLLTSALPRPQASVIAAETCSWGQSVITNYCFLYGSNLMTYWQGIYMRSSLLVDATNVVNGTIVQVLGMTTSGMLHSGGVVFAGGGPLSEDRLIAKGVVFADGVTYASGVVFADGYIAADTALSELLVQPKVVVQGD